MTPLPRYINTLCCSDDTHCLHINNPGSAIRLCCALHRLIVHLRSKLREYPNCVIVCTGDLLSGRENAAPSDVLAATADWGAVHGLNEAYERIANQLLTRFRTHTSLKRQREDTSSSGNQRSRGNSFTDGSPGPPAVSLYASSHIRSLSGLRTRRQHRQPLLS